MVREIIDMLDQLGIDKVHLLGEVSRGWGGMVLAAEYSERMHSVRGGLICFLRRSKFFSMVILSRPEGIHTLGPEGWTRGLFITDLSLRLKVLISLNGLLIIKINLMA